MEKLTGTELARASVRHADAVRQLAVVADFKELRFARPAARAAPGVSWTKIT